MKKQTNKHSLFIYSLGLLIPILGLAVLMNSCTNEQQLTLDPTKTVVLADGRLQIPINLNLPVMVEQQVTTRGTEKDPNEKKVNNFWVLVFEAPSGSSVNDYNSTDRLLQIVKGSVTSTQKCYAVLESSSSAGRVKVLINVSSATELSLNAFRTVSNGGTVTRMSDYEALSETLTSLYGSADTDLSTVQTSFPMSSDGAYLSSIGSTTQMTLDVKSIYARIEVISTAADFTLSSATLLKGANKASYRGILTSDFGGTIRYAAKVASSGLISPIYLFPNRGTKTIAGDNATDLIVQGAFAGNTSYYKIRIVYGTNNYDINPNTLYKVSINSVKGPGYTTFAEAEANTPANIDYTIEVSETDVNTADMVISNGQYYMGLSNSEVWFYNYPNMTEEEVLATLTLGTSTGQSLPSAASRTITTNALPSEMTLITTSADLNVVAGTPVEIKAKILLPNIDRTVTIRIGDLEKKIRVKSAYRLPFGTNYISVPNVISAVIAKNRDNYLRMSTSNGSYPTIYQSRLDNNGTAQTVYLCTPAKIDTVGSYESEIYFTCLESNSGRIKVVAMQKTVDHGGILYFNGSGRLLCGKIGSSTTSSPPFTFVRANMAFFKFGSVIGSTNFTTNQHFELTDIKFNPSRYNLGTISDGTTITSYAAGADGMELPGIPGYRVSDGGLGTKGFISSPSYHNVANVRLGKGDPCKLVGKTGLEIRDMTDVDLANYDSGWRLPTEIEQADFVGLSGAGIIRFSNTTFPYYGNSSGAWINNEGVSTNPAYGYFPIEGGAFAAQAVGRTFNPTGAVLPAAGYIHHNTNSNMMYNSYNSGFYWASSVYDNIRHGYALGFDVSGITVFGYLYKYSFSVRCVRNKK